MANATGKSVRILVLDDHAIVRAGLRMLIESHRGMTVIGEAGNRADAMAIAGREQPDIILLDLDMGAESGLDFLDELLAVAPEARVLVLTGVRDAEAHRRAVLKGAMGLVLKDKAAEVLVKAIEKVHGGEVWLDRTLTANVLEEMRQSDQKKRSHPENEKISLLTEREREVLDLVCQGLKNKQIANNLFISEATVRNHLTSILGKLELSDRFELALFAYRHHLAKPPGAS